MIAIVDYGNTASKEIELLLQELSEKSIISNKEKDILKADKLILPDCKDLLSSIKKLHLLNLFSILRMIKKPILGIGTGMHLMTKTYKKINAACLGCFPVECELKTDTSDSVIEEHSINIIKETKLLKNIGNADKFIFNTSCFIPVNEFTTSTININAQISASIEKDNLFGVQFNPEKSGEAGLKILKNFIKI